MQTLQERIPDARAVYHAAEEFDPTLRSLDPTATGRRIEAWAWALIQSNLTRSELLEGVRRVYTQDRKSPMNPLAAIMAEAHRYRSSRPYRTAEDGTYSRRALPPTSASRAIPACYAGVWEVPCPACGAEAGAACHHDSGIECKVPHRVRVHAARDITAEAI